MGVSGQLEVEEAAGLHARLVLEQDHRRGTGQGPHQVDLLDGATLHTGHGGVVQLSALIDALRRGRIAGAGLDVFENEPLPPNSPLWSLPNVLITPHVASAGPAYWSDAAALVCDNLERILTDRPLIDEVNEQWYAPLTQH
ncbi:MAG: hypothetical protein CVU59_10560 [Deltaproteobacteria bacterium HGW-Deltaproteobacteria-17]|nr:MAG: hypothetical protein CVU59_10560 [Deltaproteobacteria bacterium HGW-Deltaproteobacteria-17]